MNTNQMMQIQIGNFGTLEIGHLTKMGKVSQVIEMGNKIRKDKGLNELPLDNILERQSLWEFIISRDTQMNSKIKQDDSPYLKLLNYKTLEGKIQYGELMKKFPDLIKSKRGRYGGTWAELFILLYIADLLGVELQIERNTLDNYLYLKKTE
jgi:hypothetical protein